MYEIDLVWAEDWVTKCKSIWAEINPHQKTKRKNKQTNKWSKKKKQQTNKQKKKTKKQKQKTTNNQDQRQNNKIKKSFFCSGGKETLVTLYTSWKRRWEEKIFLGNLEENQEEKVERVSEI